VANNAGTTIKEDQPLHYHGEKYNEKFSMLCNKQQMKIAEHNIYVTSSRVTHNGHVFFFSSHVVIHRGWKRCKHGTVIMSSSTSNSDKQMEQLLQ
jgi:hypothetical protein